MPTYFSPETYSPTLWNLPQAQAGQVASTAKVAAGMADPYQEYRKADAGTYQSLMSNPGQIDTHALYQFLSDRGTDNVLRRFKGEKSGNLMSALQQEGINQAGKYWTTLADLYGKTSGAFYPQLSSSAAGFLTQGQNAAGELERMAAGNRAGATMQRQGPVAGGYGGLNPALAAELANVERLSATSRYGSPTGTGSLSTMYDPYASGDMYSYRVPSSPGKTVNDVNYWTGMGMSPTAPTPWSGTNTGGYLFDSGTDYTYAPGQSTIYNAGPTDWSLSGGGDTGLPDGWAETLRLGGEE